MVLWSQMTPFTMLVSFITWIRVMKEHRSHSSCLKKQNLSFSSEVFSSLYRPTCTVSLHWHQMRAGIPISRLFYLEWSAVSKLKLPFSRMSTWYFNLWKYFPFLSSPLKIQITCLLPSICPLRRNVYLGPLSIF